MFRPYPLFIAWRYVFSRHRRGFISFISVTSMLGLALGVCALITVLSVMNGFEKELRERMLGISAHATLYARTDTTPWQQTATLLQQREGVVGVAPFINGEAVLMRGRRVQGAIIHGILPRWEQAISSVDGSMVAGRLDDLQAGAYRIVLGKTLAENLGVGPGETLTLAVPEFSSGIAGLLPRLRQFRVSGVFEIGMYDYDAGIAFIHLDDAMRLYRRDRISGLRLQTGDLMTAPRLSRELVDTVPGEYLVVDWTQRHSSFFRALKTERIAMFVILSLIIAVAAFNIVATLMMNVTDKRANIAILRTMGAHRRGILAMFMLHGMVIALVGILLGMAGGVWLALNVEALVQWLETYLGIDFLAPDIYYISELPSDLRWSDVSRICTVAFALSILATLYPAWKAAGMQPAEILRGE